MGVSLTCQPPQMIDSLLKTTIVVPVLLSRGQIINNQSRKLTIDSAHDCKGEALRPLEIWRHALSRQSPGTIYHGNSVRTQCRCPSCARSFILLPYQLLGAFPTEIVSREARDECNFSRRHGHVIFAPVCLQSKSVSLELGEFGYWFPCCLVQCHCRKLLQAFIIDLTGLMLPDVDPTWWNQKCSTRSCQSWWSTRVAFSTKTSWLPTCSKSWIRSLWDLCSGHYESHK